MSNTDEVLYYLHRAKDRVSGGAAPPPERADAVRYTREQLEAALPFVHAGAELPEGARLKPLKVAALGVMRPVTSNQGPFNRTILQALDGATAAVEQLAQRVEVSEQHANRLQAGVATSQLTVDDLVDDVRSLRTEVAGLTEALSALRDDVAAGRTEQATLRSRQDLILRTAREALAADGYEAGQLTALSRELGTGFEELYEDLEDTFRGTAAQVQAKLAPYVDDVRASPATGPAIDVGCGRGEWLELLRDADIDAYGVDVNSVVVARCTDKGLDVREADALAHLRDLEADSARAVTSFHVAEHLSLETLVELIDAALVALAPGGVLILETPNPTNVNVGASSFYLDPTHLKPLHPQFLEFLVGQRGFAATEVRYLNPPEGPRLSADDLAANGELARSQALAERIDWALAGPMDYCVIGTKAGATP